MTKPRTRLRLVASGLAALTIAASCSVASDLDVAGPITALANPEATSTPDSSPDSNSFDDHTRDRLASVAEFESMAADGPGGMFVVKFTIPDVMSADTVYWMDSNFYQLHDEWYWFRLLNGAAIPASDAPSTEDSQLDDPGFDSIEAVYQWAEEQNQLPHDLEILNPGRPDQRLYARAFYDLSIRDERRNSPRNYFIGSLLRLPGAGQSDHWLVELEYSDTPTAAEMERLLSVLGRSLASDIGDNLKWVLRAPQHEALAHQIIASNGPMSSRIVSFNELIPSGEMSVYNPGITAGRLLLVEDDADTLANTKPSDILLLQSSPDWLPPASAVITSDPQTPLAHINLLARNRQIPNASINGLLDNPAILSAARARGYAVVKASPGGAVEITLISKAHYNQWAALGVKGSIAVDPIDRNVTPLTVDLVSVAASDPNVAELSPIIGGKSAGFLALLAAEGVVTPAEPLAITVAPYLDHLELVRPQLDAILGDPAFVNSARIRFLLLEGPEDYSEQFSRPEDKQLAEEFGDAHLPDTLIGDVLQAGGFKKFFRAAPMDAENLATITSELEIRFGHYAPTQGLRFRSSSNVEDIEGFNGAGLYDSNTGFLDPAAQESEKDQKKSVERTIKKTWSSYWGFEAFEERRLENVTHLSGAMGVLVHARFDDPLEQNNGVATLTLFGEGAEHQAELEVNVQLGDTSVTNPDPASGELPETAKVFLSEADTLRIERIDASTLAADQQVMSDEELLELFDQLRSTTEFWLERDNSSLGEDQRSLVLTLDFEFKTMAAGWPALAADDPAADGAFPSRLVIKQARSLEPGLRGIAPGLLAEPIPRDVLARANLVRRVSCPEPDGSWLEVFTNPLLVPDVGFSQKPFRTSSAPIEQTSDSCITTQLFATADRFLSELLADGTKLSLTNQLSTEETASPRD